MSFLLLLLLIQLPLALGLNQLEAATLMAKTSGHIAPLMTAVSFMFWLNGLCFPSFTNVKYYPGIGYSVYQ